MPRWNVLGTLLLLGAVLLGLAAMSGTARAAAETPSTDASTPPGLPGAPTMPEAPPVTPLPIEAPSVEPQVVAGSPTAIDTVMPDFGAGVSLDVIPVPIVEEPLWRPLPIPF